jgi:hypothetical protein
MKCEWWFVHGARIDFILVQRNGAPVWLYRAAWYGKNVVQWLADKGIKPPAVDAIVLRCGELELILV